MRRLLLVALFLAVAAGPAWAANRPVAIRNSAFDPPNLVVAPGDTVTWTNHDAVQHTATATNGTFDSKQLSQNQSFSHTFQTAGTFAYRCDNHPNMQGTVTVQAAGGGTTTSSTSSTTTSTSSTTTTTTRPTTTTSTTRPTSTTTTSTTTPDETTTTTFVDETTSTTEENLAASTDDRAGDDGGDPSHAGQAAVAALLLAAVSGAAALAVKRGL